MAAKAAVTRAGGQLTAKRIIEPDGSNISKAAESDGPMCVVGLLGDVLGWASSKATGMKST